MSTVPRQWLVGEGDPLPDDARTKNSVDLLRPHASPRVVTVGALTTCMLPRSRLVHEVIDKPSFQLDMAAALIVLSSCEEGS